MAKGILKGIGNIDEITTFLIDEVQKKSVITQLVYKGEEENIRLLVFEKHYFRNNSRASLTIMLVQQEENELMIHIVGSGGGTGLFIDWSFGANTNFATKIADILGSRGFKEVPKSDE
jgi:hypothetical protein